MARYPAVAAVCEAVVAFLRSSVRPGEFNNPVEFQVFTSRNFANPPITNGVSLFLYRLFVNGVRRTPPGRLGPDGRPLPSLLPVEMHFLLTVWAGEASLQHTLAGWTMRKMEDAAILPAALLNSVVPRSFNDDETIEISIADLTTDDLMHLYEVLMPNVYQLSIPYLARIINIEAEAPIAPTPAAEVQEREHRFGVLVAPEAAG